VPSRRLGRSLGINNIPPKVCSFSCLYCQVGPTMDRDIVPRTFYPPVRVAHEVIQHIERARRTGEQIDYLTFVPDGEPTLDAGLAESIGLLRPLKIPIAVISNGSLLWRGDVRTALELADWVSVKVDAATDSVWRRVNRPHPALALADVQDGIRRFAASFAGELVSETMLIEGINDAAESVAAVAGFLRRVRITKAYLAIPTRPTPYPTVTAPDEATVNRAFQVLAGLVPTVEYLVGYEGDAFAATGDARSDLLAITAVHPMRESAVERLLSTSGEGWAVVEDLIGEGSLCAVAYENQTFYLRRWR
jgi:wyosine [tRNA(Phe)-imidazoG37] synthetase (radical SAM superfamily)